MEHLIFQEAKNELTKKVSYTITLCLFLFSVYSFFLARQFFAIILISGVLCAFVSSIIYYKKEHVLASKILVILAIIVNSYQICFVTNVLHIVDIFWYIVFILFSYFVLGNKWGKVSLIIFISCFFDRHSLIIILSNYGLNHLI